MFCSGLGRIREENRGVETREERERESGKMAEDWLLSVLEGNKKRTHQKTTFSDIRNLMSNMRF